MQKSQFISYGRLPSLAYVLQYLFSISVHVHYAKFGLKFLSKSPIYKKDTRKRIHLTRISRKNLEPIDLI